MSGEAVAIGVGVVAPTRHGHSKGIVVREALHRRGLCGSRFVCDNCHHIAKVVGEFVVDGWNRSFLRSGVQCIE